MSLSLSGNAWEGYEENLPKLRGKWKKKKKKASPAFLLVLCQRLAGQFR